MVDEQQPAKKVVKRVVKKTVTRPASAPAAQNVRYGRAVSTTAIKPQAKAAARLTSRPVPKPANKSAGTATKSRPPVGAKVGAAGKALSSRGAGVASRTAGIAGTAGRATGTFAADRFHAARAWRVPHLDPRLASVITGLVVGLVSVGLGLVALEIFSEVRGVASGGGRWGTLTFVLVAFIAMVLGDLLLSAFGVAQAGLISFLGVILAIVAILALFLDLAATQWALALVPAVGALTYLVAQWLMTLAESSPASLE
ncbi:hypothetical protein [Aeromicrobium sp.]|uniref:hypothetical protein n=1 Tax=Aeromicrobium sp. TaxID=1871063 RepID=UPI0030BA6B1F